MKIKGSYALGSIGLLTCLLTGVISQTHSSGSRPHTNKPFTLDNIIRSCKPGKRERRTAQNFIRLIKREGVDFLLTSEDELEIRSSCKYLGESGLDEFIKAVKYNYHSDTSQHPTPTTPSVTSINQSGGITAGGDVTINQEPPRRHLTTEQRARLLEVLSQRPKGDVLIWFAIGNNEAEDFARELGTVFVDSGWRVRGYVPTSLNINGEFPRGLLVYLPTEEAANATAFSQALSQIIPVTLDTRPRRQEDVVLYVGRKP